MGEIPCETCDKAHEFPGYRMHNPACIFCGARLIQNLAKLPIADSQCSKRRKAVLADWLSFGHDEARIRALVNGPLPLAPKSIKGPKTRR